MLKNALLCLAGVALLSACGKKQNELMACDAPQHKEFIANRTKNMLLKLGEGVFIQGKWENLSHTSDDMPSPEMFEISDEDFKVTINDMQKMSALNDKQGKEIQCRATTEITFSGSLNGIQAQKYETIYTLSLSETSGKVALDFVNDKRDFLATLIYNYVNKKNGLENNGEPKPNLREVKINPSSNTSRLPAAPSQKIIVKPERASQVHRSISGERVLAPTNKRGVPQSQEINQPNQRESKQGGEERTLEPVKKSTTGNKIEKLF